MSLWTNSLQKQHCFRRLVDESWSVTIQMKATKQYFPVVLFITLHRVVLTFESVDEILKCDQTLYYVEQGMSSFWASGRILKCDHSNKSSPVLWFSRLSLWMKS